MKTECKTLVWLPIEIQVETLSCMLPVMSLAMQESSNMDRCNDHFKNINRNTSLDVLMELTNTEYTLRQLKKQVPMGGSQNVRVHILLS